MADKLSVLRECNRILKPGGRMAGYVIHTPAGLSPAQAERATTWGPSYVTGPATPEELAQQAGFVVRERRDVTGEYRATSAAFLQARTELEAALRAAEGDAAFEAERTQEEETLAGIDEGLLLRSLLVTEKPTSRP